MIFFKDCEAKITFDYIKNKFFSDIIWLFNNFLSSWKMVCCTFWQT